MLSCLILHHKTITSLTKIMLLRTVFHEEEFEIHVIGQGTVIMYLWNVDKAVILQAALIFETEQIETGFGFGDCKRNALNNAQAIYNHPQNYQQS
ncbi:hypothetical protein [Lentibacillus salicampi]|uniref:Uncharacterized protein n=1 Tax=Lentibacillus salicampi TaxID=175306 RepID=A0A4Y9A722_9BACI|nr:hypothetical protein [Lentibacillus salicampi]TFJ91483.1 hypothetical protein E4U82_17485 [Lentibacillus salicampi]